MIGFTEKVAPRFAMRRVEQEVFRDGHVFSCWCLIMATKMRRQVYNFHTIGSSRETKVADLGEKLLRSLFIKQDSCTLFNKVSIERERMFIYVSMRKTR